MVQHVGEDKRARRFTPEHLDKSLCQATAKALVVGSKGIELQCPGRCGMAAMMDSPNPVRR